MTFPSDALLGTSHADGDSRPFMVYDLGTLPSPRLVHVEKSGPAFYRPEQPPIKAQLEQSLQSQAVMAAGDVLRALKRRVLLDVCGAWPRLLKAASVTSQGARREPRQAWAWEEMKDAVELAMGHPPESIYWQDADAMLRGYALAVAQSTESRLNDSDVSEHAAVLSDRALVYRAFGEGRL